MDLFHQATECADVAVHRFVPIHYLGFNLRLGPISHKNSANFWNATVH
jgi:hypothetical protein